MTQRRAGFRHYDTDNVEEISQVAQSRIGYKHYDSEQNDSQPSLQNDSQPSLQQMLEEMMTPKMSTAQAQIQSKINNIGGLIVSDSFPPMSIEEKTAYLQELVLLVSTNAELELRELSKG